MRDVSHIYGSFFLSSDGFEAEVEKLCRQHKVSGLKEIITKVLASKRVIVNIDRTKLNRNSYAIRYEREGDDEIISIDEAIRRIADYVNQPEVVESLQ